jgi:hypothetical protein
MLAPSSFDSRRVRVVRIVLGSLQSRWMKRTVVKPSVVEALLFTLPEVAIPGCIVNSCWYCRPSLGEGSPEAIEDGMQSGMLLIGMDLDLVDWVGYWEGCRFGGAPLSRVWCS